MKLPKLPFSPDGVLLDCDSTLSTIEGINQLAEIANCQKEIEKLTNAAMNGEIPLENVYTKRLELIQPTRYDIENLRKAYLSTITPGAFELVDTLHQEGIKVGIVSGGLRIAIEPLAAALQIDSNELFAVELFFDENDKFAGVKPTPLTHSRGKFEVSNTWKQQHNLQRIVFIGDGMSDVMALGAVEAVIGYGGVIYRKEVEKKATLYYKERDLSGILSLLQL